MDRGGENGKTPSPYMRGKSRLWRDCRAKKKTKRKIRRALQQQPTRTYAHISHTNKERPVAISKRDEEVGDMTHLAKEPRDDVAENDGLIGFMVVRRSGDACEVPEITLPLV